MNHNHNCYTK